MTKLKDGDEFFYEFTIHNSIIKGSIIYITGYFVLNEENCGLQAVGKTLDEMMKNVLPKLKKYMGIKEGEKK